MKTRFSTIDIRAAIAELRERFLGMRVANVYDVDNKTYLIKLAKPDEKAVILLESGNRIHSTDFDWPKNMAPSGFSMKMRKHLRTRRLESVEQLGVDRIVDLQFGSGEAAYHVILELYDRGNIVLTDYEYIILNILRPRADDSQDVRFAVREKYPVELAKQQESFIALERLQAILNTAKVGDNLKRILIPHLTYGPAVIEHCLIGAGFPGNVAIGKGFDITEDIAKLLAALVEAEEFMTKSNKSGCKGFVIQKKEKKPIASKGEVQELLTYEEFHPFLFRQHEKSSYVELETFNKAVDEFFSKLESQKFDTKALQQEKSALKKLENVKKDHEKRLNELEGVQELDAKKAQLIEINLQMVDRAIMIVQSALANQIDWTEIHNIVKEAQLQGDPVAGAIKGLKLDINHITMLLGSPFVGSFFGDDDDDGDEDVIKPMKIDIDLSLSAYANARRFFDMRRTAAKKQQKTIDASSKALKSAERKTKETLKEVATKVNIMKARKTFWFEKFLWFISSENYLIIAGRDQQQNEMIYKRYFRAGDIYVHADLHGASSIIIKNISREPIPPKTLNEAGTMAICNSAAWDAKVVTSAWWVYHDQVSKTAPTGEYLTTGSFMIRGRKNYLPPSYLVYGFGVLFKVDETSIFRHKGERQVFTAEEYEISLDSNVESEASQETNDLDISDDDDSDSDESSRSGQSLKSNQSDASCEQGEKLQKCVQKNVKLEDIEQLHLDTDANGTEINTVIDVSVNKEEDSVNSNITNNTNIKMSDMIQTDDKINVDQNVCELDMVAKQQEKEDEEPLFPDTTISLAHVKGDKYQLQRGTSSASNMSEDIDLNIYLGDSAVVTLNDKAEPKDRLSAKQRREMKKKRQNQNQQQEQADDDDDEVGVLKKQLNQGNSKEQQQLQPPPKRGQKAKMKKIKEKYGEQDEEERHLKMELLASSGQAKEVKKKKGKKAKQQLQEYKQQNKQQKLPTKPQQGQKAQMSKGQGQDAVKIKDESLATDIASVESTQDSTKGELAKVEGPSADPKQAWGEEEDTGNQSDDEKQAVLEEENITLVQDADILDSLTGMPQAEDELLFAIPFCAPYVTLQNFKFKVKLTPGSTKRGKAAKAALRMFTFDRTASSREKDLLKSMKDADLSRSIPGKVKVSAPNLHKVKGKKK